MPLSRFQISCLSACLALPILLLMKVIGGIDSAFGTFATGVASLLVVFLVPKLYFREGPPKHDPFYNVWSIFLFASLVDMVIALENDGYIDKYLHFYLLQGEPYLKTAFGTMINYWDGTVHLGLVLFILSRTAYNEDYRLACMYWCGSILNSVAVLVPGGAIGKFGPKWSILLNIPYIVIPLYIFFSVLSSRSASKRNVLTSLGVRAPQSPVDYTFAIFFMGSIVVNGFRAAVILGCKADMTKNYLKNFEPFLGDDTAFPKMQMLVYLFYFIPFYVYAIYRILYPVNGGMLTDLAVFHAGAAAQAQFVYMTTAAHSRTDLKWRVPSDPIAQYCFWAINIALFLIPHLFAYRCVVGSPSGKPVPASPTKKHEPVQENESSPYNLRRRKLRSAD